MKNINILGTLLLVTIVVANSPLKLLTNVTKHYVDQVEIIICDHRVASINFKCNLEYGKIDLNVEIETAKLNEKCSSVFSVDRKQNSDANLVNYCVNKLKEIQEYKERWHNAIAKVCYKTFLDSIGDCPNSKLKILTNNNNIKPILVYKKPIVTEVPIVTLDRPAAIVSPDVRPQIPLHISDKPEKTDDEEHKPLPAVTESLYNYIFGVNRDLLFKPDVEKPILTQPITFSEAPGLFFFDESKSNKYYDDADESGPGYVGKSRPIHLLKPKPIHIWKPKPVVVENPKPVHSEKPETDDEKSEQGHVSKPKPVYVGEPKPVHFENPKPIHIEKPEIGELKIQLLIKYIFGKLTDNPDFFAHHNLHPLINFLFRENHEYIEELTLQRILEEIYQALPIHLIPAELKPISSKPIVFEPIKVEPVTPKPIVFESSGDKPIIDIPMLGAPTDVQPVGLKPSPSDPFDISFIFRMAHELVKPGLRNTELMKIPDLTPELQNRNDYNEKEARERKFAPSIELKEHEFENNNLNTEQVLAKTFNTNYEFTDKNGNNFKKIMQLIKQI